MAGGTNGISGNLLDAGQQYGSVPGMRAEPPDEPSGRWIVFFDGTCGLCDRTVHALHWLDTNDRLWFAPLQGETARRLALAADTSADGTVLVAYETNGQIQQCYERCMAVLQALRVAGGIAWLGVALAAPLPTTWCERTYRWVARNRLRWFGHKDACSLPSDSLGRRLLG